MVQSLQFQRLFVLANIICVNFKNFEKCFERILREGEEKRPLLKKGKGYIHKLYLERKVLYSRSFLKLLEVERESLETLGSLMELINQRRKESE